VPLWARGETPSEGRTLNRKGISAVRDFIFPNIYFISTIDKNNLEKEKKREVVSSESEHTNGTADQDDSRDKIVTSDKTANRHACSTTC
jgi:hypothetical protein